LSKDASKYLINAVFCNYSEINEFVRDKSDENQIKEESHELLSESTLLDLHSHIFKLINFFCQIERTVLVEFINSTGLEKLLFEYTNRVSFYHILKFLVECIC